MKLLSCSLLLFLLLTSFPVTTHAFSRRTHHSEMGPQTAPINTAQTVRDDVSAQAVPEPPVLLFMGIGIGMLAMAVSLRRFRVT